MNRISQEQNSLNQLEKLAAQRQLYSNAKTIQNISILTSVPLVIFWSICVAIFSKIEVYAALWGIAVTILEVIVLNPFVKSLQEKAALIQQMFDCDVLELNWSNLNCGSRVEPETIIDAAVKYRKKNLNYSSLENWYPISTGQLPIHQARIICQRSNVWWDAQLRLRYSRWVLFVLLIMTMFVFLLGLIGGLTLEKFVFAVLAPLTPTFVFGLRQYTENKEAASKLDRLREAAESIWDTVINNRITPQDLEKESYVLQTQIYDNRRRNPLIPDWIYSQLKRKIEEQMNKGAEVLISEIQQIS